MFYVDVDYESALPNVRNGEPLPTIENVEEVMRRTGIETNCEGCADPDDPDEFYFFIPVIGEAHIDAPVLRGIMRSELAKFGIFEIDLSEILAAIWSRSVSRLWEQKNAK